MQRDMQRQEGRLTVEALRNSVDVSFIVNCAKQHGNMTCILEKEEEREGERDNYTETCGKRRSY
jgi:hypothetical protein